MIWQSPWALLGLLAVAVPVIVHLLGRRTARLQKFPTLRFIGASRLMATRWTRLSDLALLAVRMGIVAAAAMALAQPLLLTPNRQAQRGRSVARAIIVDTSASMGRPGKDGAPAIDRARQEAQRLARETATDVVLETAAPARAMTGAVRWLTARPGQRELHVISDFQTGTVDSTDVAAVPSDIRFVATVISVVAGTEPLEISAPRGSARLLARITTDSARTNVEWTLGAPSAGVSASDRNVAPVPATGARDSLVILAGASERAQADAALEAARVARGPSPVIDRPIAIVHRGYEQRAAVLRDAGPLSTPWQGDIVARLARDSMLIAAAADADVGAAVDAGRGVGATVSTGERSSEVPRTVVIARTSAGRPVVLAGMAPVAGRERLVLFSLADAGSLASAALIASAMHASAAGSDVGEMEPSVIPDATLARWRNAPAAPAAATPERNPDSDGRWLWVVALVLLGAETWMRRERRAAQAPEIVRERAA